MLIDVDETSLVRLARRVAETGYSFVTPTPATIARVNARAAGAPRGTATLNDVFGWSRPFAPGDLPAQVESAAREAGVLSETAGGLRSAVRLSMLDGTLFMHSAYPTVEENAVFFGPDTYRFARAIKPVLPAGPRRVVDIGCGAGPGAIVVARARREAAEVFAVDINDAALHLARVNAAVAGVRLEARHSDLLGAVDGAFDLIVSNPPYLVDPGARAYRHGGGPLGAGLSLKILETAIERLAPGGTLLLYTGVAIVDGTDPFRAAAAERLDGSGLGWTYEEIDPDVFGEELENEPYAQTDRIAAVLLTVHRT